MEVLIFFNVFKFIGVIKDFLENFKKIDIVLGMFEEVFILVVLVFFCENYCFIVLKIFDVKFRDYAYFKGKEIFLFWGFGMILVFLFVLFLVVFFDIKI